MHSPSLRQDEQLQEPVASKVEGQDSSAAIPILATMERLLVEAAIQRPEADALIGSFGSISYADLLIRAQNIAVALRRHGVQTGHFVGVAMDQSPVMITSIVGILLAGAAYVPLGRELLADTQVLRQLRENGMAVILCDRAHGTGSCTVWKESGVVLDASRLEQQTMPSSTETRMPDTTIDSPAAMLFRRHALGEQAMGVVISHRAIASLVSGSSLIDFKTPEVLHNETFLLHPVSGTRTSLLEMWGSLLHGATLALAPEVPLQGGLLPAGELATTIRQLGVSTLCLPVSGLHDLIAAAPQIFSRLNHLVIELEQDGNIGTLAPQHLEWLVSSFPRLHIVNTYGTLETSGYATSYRIPQRYAAEGAVPIGEPIHGMQAVILDRELFPAREGEIGELAFRGDGVVHGYLDNPDATAQRFLRNAPSHDSGDSHLFLTGERARWRSDGLLELHGKSAKHRMGAGEQAQPLPSSAAEFGVADIEVMLMSQQRVRDAVIVEQTSGEGLRRHVAFVALDEIARITSDAETQAALEESMRRALPAAAMPASFQYVDSIPRDSRGAANTVLLDVHLQQAKERALAAQEREQADLALEQQREDILSQVKALWLRLLQRTSVGEDENFFDAGGTQVQMIRMHVELNRLYPGSITMANLSVLKTIRGIYNHLMKLQAPAAVPRRA